MKNTARNILLVVFCFAASALYGASPSVNITVKQRPGGKIVKQVTTDSNGNFSVGTLPAGPYTLEFRSPRSTDVSNKQFSISVAGTKTTGKQSVAGSSLVGGLALNVEVRPNANVSGNVATGATVVTEKKKMVWIPPMTGSNRPGRWAEEGSADAVASKARGTFSTQSVLDGATRK